MEPAELSLTEVMKEEGRSKHGYKRAHSVAPRSSGDLANVYAINDFKTQKEILTFPDPVIATIDLDYFIDVPNDQLEQQISEIFDYVFKLKQLKAITISISRPYLSQMIKRITFYSLPSNIFRRSLTPKYT